MELEGGDDGRSTEGELELGLGLSLGGAVRNRNRNRNRNRILTAKDFPNAFSSARKRERPNQPSAAAAAAVSQVVGWPPIRSYRMNTLSNQAKASNVEEQDKEVGDENNESSNKKINHGSEKGLLGFVKVNMDGLPIGRKLDLNAHNTYQSLAKALEEMFFKGGGKEPPKLLDGSSEFVLTYDDKEGDWMLVGDVPWGMFLSSVKRLRIMQTSEAKGLAPKSQEMNEKQKNKLI